MVYSSEWKIWLKHCVALVEANITTISFSTAGGLEQGEEGLAAITKALDLYERDIQWASPEDMLALEAAKTALGLLHQDSSSEDGGGGGGPKNAQKLNALLKRGPFLRPAEAETLLTDLRGGEFFGKMQLQMRGASSSSKEANWVSADLVPEEVDGLEEDHVVVPVEPDVVITPPEEPGGAASKKKDESGAKDTKDADEKKDEPAPEAAGVPPGVAPRAPPVAEDHEDDSDRSSSSWDSSSWSSDSDSSSGDSLRSRASVASRLSVASRASSMASYASGMVSGASSAASYVGIRRRRRRFQR